MWCFFFGHDPMLSSTNDGKKCWRCFRCLKIAPRWGR